MADEENRFSPESEDDQEDDDQFLMEYFRKSPEVELFRPTLADEQKIGFFSLDRACQTEESEIIDLKQMTEVIKDLTQEAATMKRDINFARHVMEADFEAKLQQKSIDLYCRVNDQIAEIEKIHLERVSTVRRAFKQQLSDAIARMHTYYNRISKESQKKDASKEKFEGKFRDMQATIQRNESIIHMLKTQLAQYQQDAEEREVLRPPSRTESVIAEIDGLRDEISDFETKVTRLEKGLDARDGVIKDLNQEVQSYTEQLERERIMVEQLKHEKEELSNAAEQDKASAKRQMANARLQVEREMEEKMKKAKGEVLEKAKQEAQMMQEAEQNKLKQLAEEKKKIEMILTQERAKANEKTQDTIDLEKARKNEQRLNAEVLKMKAEVERIHQTWEKKFAILQQSLHALKDESYLRQTMQRQAAQLHQASISYAYDQPVGITPRRPPQPPPSQPTKKPLPNIGGKNKGKSPAPDYISYTVSAQSGRATALAAMDENQVMSEDEADLPSGILPLPSPPQSESSGTINDCASEQNAMDSRPSTRSHVVVLPSVEAQ